MRNICSLVTKFQNSRNIFRTINSVAYATSNNKKGDIKPQQHSEQFQKEHLKCVNEVTLLGRLSKDPQMLTVEGKPTVILCLVTSSYENNCTDWHYAFTQNPVSVKFLKTYMKKGMRIYISGKLKWLNKDNKAISSVLINNFVSFG